MLFYLLTFLQHLSSSYPLRAILSNVPSLRPISENRFAKSDKVFALVLEQLTEILPMIMNANLVTKVNSRPLTDHLCETKFRMSNVYITCIHQVTTLMTLVVEK